ncbi:hypothetical protein EJ08DRAFT_37493 [Tothia fuscella]|uniref:Fatty acid desaturase domain-containing protein n=1 Tax=Tothia fuscella TaxID=1048955 RepID=A0A9P4NXX2_9PEZI|nr:hypothetical protein EJ08DRAFT_37493 [Tothia fuscella]
MAITPDELIDPQLTGPDLLVLKNLLGDVEKKSSVPIAELGNWDPGFKVVLANNAIANGKANGSFNGVIHNKANGHANIYANGPANGNVDNGTKGSILTTSVSDRSTIEALEALNNPESEGFEPTVFFFWDLPNLPPALQSLLVPYIKFAQTIVRNPTDVVMFTHLLLYFTTSVPSAIYLFRHFTWTHGILHWLMQSWYVGTYTLMRHQHIHMGGVLAKTFPINVFDSIFPYVTDPLLGHTWNSYYYHHVKHHHVEANGPDDLSSTLRYQRDDLLNFLHYVGRFLILIWAELPLYFLSKNQPSKAFRAAFWEWSNLALIVYIATLNFRPALFVLVLPFLVIRCGLMVGNWGQHALVDEIEPDSDFRSSITLIDVASNRFCFNDGYHTSHHLNPRRHWRDHPVSFIKQKERYADEHALVFRNIDYIMITIRLLRKEYEYLARCLVPIGEQIDMTLEDKAEMLRRKTRKFSEEEIKEKFGQKGK